MHAVGISCAAALELPFPNNRLNIFLLKKKEYGAFECIFIINYNLLLLDGQLIFSYAVPNKVSQRETGTTDNYSSSNAVPFSLLIKDSYPTTNILPNKIK